MQKATGFRPVALKTRFITKSQAGALIAAMIIMPPFERMSMRLRITWIIRHVLPNAKCRPWIRLAGTGTNNVELSLCTIMVYRFQ